MPSSKYDLAGFKTVINTTIPYKIIDDIFFTFISTLLIILFFIGYKIIESKKTEQISQNEIIKWSVIFSILMASAIPSHSSDVYGYISRGAQQSLYHQNPYIEAVSKIKNYSSDPMFINFMWPNQQTTYGPVFIYLTKAIVFLSNNNFFLSLVNFKLFNLTLFFFLILLALKVGQIKDIYLIAWNPLILIQGLWNCHNDLFSGLLIFFGLYLLKNQKYFWSVFCLTFAAGIKFVTLIIIPIIFFYFLKSKTSKNTYLNLVLGMCCGVILTLIFSIDYLINFHEIPSESINRIISNVGLVHKSLIATIFTLIKYFCHWQKYNCDLSFILNILKSFFYFAFCVFYIFMLSKKKSNLINDITFVLFIFFCFVIAKFHSWYLLNFIVLIPFLEKGFLKNMLLTLSMTHAYAITFVDQAKILNFTSMTLLPSLFVFFKRKK